MGIDKSRHYKQAAIVVKVRTVGQVIDPFGRLDQHLHSPLPQDQQAVIKVFEGITGLVRIGYEM